MRKSQLRSIIKESIKELMTEQTYSPGHYVSMQGCDPSGPFSTSAVFCFPDSSNPVLGGMYVNTQTVNSPLENQPGFIKSIAGPCNSIQNSVQWVATPYTGACIPCCDTNNWAHGQTTGWWVGSFDDETPQGACWNAGGCGSTPTGVYHEFERCDNYGHPPTIYYWSGAPGAPTNGHGTPAGSEAFWQFLNQPSQGQIVGIDVDGYNMCMTYLGTVQSGTHGSFGSGNSLTNPTTYTSCNDCENISTGTPGCMDSNAFNYDPSATIDDGSCDYGYRIDAGGCIQCVQYHSSCIYTTPSCDDGSQSSTPGCMDSTATNYNASATVDDGSCQYDNTQTDTCCDWCQTANFQQSIPPTGCMDWMCTDSQWISDYCPDLERGAPTIGRDPEIDRMRDLAFKGKR